MLVTFSVSNFRSFSEEETFTLVAATRLGNDHAKHTSPIPNSEFHVLKTAVIYGANGAGKSNLFKALKFLRSLAIQTRDKNSGTDRQAFIFGESTKKHTSDFDLQFIVNDKLYRFGCKVDDKRIIEEWLIHVKPVRERIIYERTTSIDGEVIIKSKILKSAGKKIDALATVGGPQNQSFLATVIATLDDSEFGEELGAIIDWFKYGLNLIGPEDKIRPVGHMLATSEDFREFASEFLHASSTGVSKLVASKVELSEEELSSLLPKNILSKIYNNLEKSSNNEIIVGLGDDEGVYELLVQKTDENHFYRIQINAGHTNVNGDLIELDLRDESDGTKRLLNLIPAIHHLRNSSAIYFIDEIDRSMHPVLVKKFLEFFLSSCDSGKQQMIVTTHESNLLDLEMLRRDEIWFAEKDTQGSTHLYSMSEFPVRKDLEIRKHYLQGRFGAIPFLGNIDNLRCIQEE